jgi:hypothetical protein
LVGIKTEEVGNCHVAPATWANISILLGEDNSEKCSQKQKKTKKNNYNPG